MISSDPVGFRKCELGEILQLQRGYDLPQKDRRDGEFPIVSSSGVTGYHNEPKSPGPGVVTGRYGTLGGVYFINQDFWPLNTALYVKDFRGNHPQFVAYLLQTLGLGGQNTAGAVPGLNRNALHKLEVRIPNLPTQQRISGILAAYDDLIENNNQRMALLEESVHLLYRDWFVRLRFPGHERTKVVDGVPKGWERTHASHAIDFSPRTPMVNDGKAAFVPMDSLSTRSMSVHPVTFRTPKGGARFIKGDTLLARITPCLENGKTGYVDFLDVGITATGSTEFIGMRGKRVPSTWVYALARSEAFRSTAINNMSGSDGRQRVNREAIEQFELCVPTPMVLNEWTAFVAPIFAKCRALREQTSRLAEARDALLPRLMNGSIPV